MKIIILMVFRWWGFSFTLQWNLHCNCSELLVLLGTCSRRVVVLAGVVAWAGKESGDVEGQEDAELWQVLVGRFSSVPNVNSPLKSFIDSLRLLNPDLLNGIKIHILISLRFGLCWIKAFLRVTVASILASAHNCNNC